MLLNTAMNSKRLIGLMIRRYATETKPKAKKTRSRKYNFIDSMRLCVRGGTGGQGFKKFGGHGGDGGDVIVRANANALLGNIFTKFPTKRISATPGKDSRKMWILGDRGEDVTIEVPLGITVKNEFGEELADLNEDEQEIVVAQGGRGGNPETNFIGRKGESQMITLDLKLIADVGLVGFPNAGKSTFLSAISRTNPKIAGYPFTTLRPYIGTMEFPDLRQITVADLPGLIEGAHLNEGMGHRFLKHVERTKLLFFVVDLKGFQLHTRYHYRTAVETILLLNKEIELYNRDILDKPAILALNKIDLDRDKEDAKSVIDFIKGFPESLNTVDSALHPEKLIKFDKVLTMSAKSASSIDVIKSAIRDTLDESTRKREEILSNYGQLNDKQIATKTQLSRRLQKMNEQSTVKLL